MVPCIIALHFAFDHIVFGKHLRAHVAATHVSFKVSTFFDTNEDAVLRFSYGVASVLNCMSFRVGGTAISSNNSTAFVY